MKEWAHAHGALTTSASQALMAAYISHPADERRLSVVTVRIHRAAIAVVHKAVDPDGGGIYTGVKLTRPEGDEHGV